MGISHVEPVCDAREITDVIGPDAIEYYEAAGRMGDTPDQTFGAWLKESPRTWQQAIDRLMGGQQLDEAIAGGTLRALSLAALRENAYSAFMTELATRCKDAGVLKVDRATAEGIIGSWR